MNKFLINFYLAVNISMNAVHIKIMLVQLKTLFNIFSSECE